MVIVMNTVTDESLIFLSELSYIVNHLWKPASFHLPANKMWKDDPKKCICDLRNTHAQNTKGSLFTVCSTL